MKIRIRAWDKGNQRMIYPSGAYTSGTILNRWDDENIMLSTGLKDKHDKEIWEGDILSVSNGSINFMEWRDAPYEVRYRLNKGFEMCMFCWDKEGENQMDSTHYCEVIGNIYENAGLLAVAP